MEGFEHGDGLDRLAVAHHFDFQWLSGRVGLNPLSERLGRRDRPIADFRNDVAVRIPAAWAGDSGSTTSTSVGPTDRLDGQAQMANSGAVDSASGPTFAAPPDRQSSSREAVSLSRSRQFRKAGGRRRRQPGRRRQGVGESRAILPASRVMCLASRSLVLVTDVERDPAVRPLVDVGDVHRQPAAELRAARRRRERA